MNTPRFSAGVLPAIILLSACAQTTPSKPRPVVAIEPVAGPEWTRKIRSEDEERLRNAGLAWQGALTEARARGFRSAIAAEGELLDPNAALERAEPPPGPYRCRVVKLGTQGKNRRAFNSFKPYFCYVEAFGSQLAITKQTGSERPSGYLYKDEGERRVIFLGSVAQGNEKRPLPYGQNEARDIVGLVERIGPFRYRLVIPWPRSDAKIEVMELVPVVE